MVAKKCTDVVTTEKGRQQKSARIFNSSKNPKTRPLKNDKDVKNAAAVLGMLLRVHSGISAATTAATGNKCSCRYHHRAAVCSGYNNRLVEC